MKITEDNFENLIGGLFGDGLTTGSIEFINDNDEVLVTRDIDEALEFGPSYVGLVTDTDEATGFALALDDIPSHFPKPTFKNNKFALWLFDYPVKSAEIPHEEAVTEIPLIDYDFYEDNFYDLSAFEQKSVEAGAGIDKTLAVTFAMAAKASASDGRWSNQQGTVANFIEMLTTHQEGKKDGACFLQGELAGDRRLAKSLIKNFFVIFDLDTGETSEEIDARLKKTGYAYIRYTTHSHMTDISTVKRTEFFRWSGMDAEKNVEINRLRKYLVEVKGYMPRILEKIEIIEDAKVSEEGTMTIFRHNEMPKHRIAFFLNEPFLFQGKTNQQEAIKAWKEHYHGFGTELGFVYDKSCIDPARLFYLPRHEKGRPFETRFVDGDYVDLRSFERLAMRREVGAANTNAFADAAKSLGATSEGLFVEGYNLKRWVVTRDCELITLLEDRYPDGIKSPRTTGPGYHIECPFEDEHTKAGGLGTYAINASDTDSGFHIHCTHNSCQGRNKLDYIKRMVENEWFSVDDLNDEQFCPSLLKDEEEQIDEEKKEELEKIDPEALMDTINKKMSKDDVIDVLRKISKHPDMTRDEFEEFVEDARKKRGMTKREMKKAYGTKFKDDAGKSDRDDEVEKILRRWNDRFALVDVGSASILDSEKDWTDSPFTKLDTWKVISSNQKILVSDGTGQKMESISKLWLEWSQRKTYTGVVFDPAMPKNSTKYNLFKGFKTQERKGDWSLLKQHIYEVLCHENDEFYDWIMTWFAHLVQRPWEKKGSALIVRGVKGAGKTTVFEFLEQMVAPYAITSSQPEHITGKFNWHFRDKLLLIAEEGLFAGSSRDDSIIKDLITGKKMLMEPKGIDAFYMDQYIRLVIISNEDWVINATSDERRYFVIDVNDKYAQDVDYFSALYNQMNNGGIEAMMYELLRFEPPFDQGWDILRTPPKTDALAKQVSQSIPIHEKFFVGLLENGSVSEFGSDLTPISLNYDKPTEIERDELRMYYYNSLVTTAARYQQTQEAFKNLVNKYLPGTKYKKFKNGDIKMVIPPLNDLIDHAQSKLKIKLDMMEFINE